MTRLEDCVGSDKPRLKNETGPLQKRACRRTSGPVTEPVRSWGNAGLGGLSPIFRNHQRHVHAGLVQKPLLQFVGAQDITDDQLIGALVSDSLSALGELAAV